MRPLTLTLALGLLAAAAGGPASAQYKVIDAQGRVTYTDRPEAPPGARVLNLGRDDRAADGDAGLAALPPSLRQVVARFPVTLYTSSDCLPCEQGRRLLTDRGVPFNERTVASNDGVHALQRLTGGRTVPSLAVGAQVLRGLQQADWSATLELAGYPAQSALPRNYKPAPPTPRGSGGQDEAAPASAEAPPARAPAAEPPAAPPSPAGPGPAIRF